MVRRSTPPQPKLAELALEKMRAAILRLQKRISELRAFDPESTEDGSDPRLGTARSR